MIESALLKRMNRSKKPFGVETRVGPRNYVGGFLGFLGAGSPDGKGHFLRGISKYENIKLADDILNLIR